MKIYELYNLTSKNGKSLPDTLYHGTTAKNAQQILKQGLDPSMAQNRGADTHTQGYVFLSRNMSGAEAFAPGGEYSTSAEPGAILAINVTPEIASHIRTDLGEFIRCGTRIPPEHIQLIKFTNTASNP